MKEKYAFPIGIVYTRCGITVGGGRTTAALRYLILGEFVAVKRARFPWITVMRNQAAGWIRQHGDPPPPPP